MLSVALVAFPRPYRQAVCGAFDPARFTCCEPEDLAGWLAEPGLRVLLVRVGGSSWELLDTFAGHPHVEIVAVLDALDIDLYVRALAHGASGVVYEDTSPEIIAAVVEATLRGEVLLPVEAAQQLGRLAVGQNHKPSALTDNEVDLIRTLAAGRSLSQIANDLGYSERTARRRLQNVYLKMEASNRSQAISQAFRLGFLD